MSARSHPDPIVSMVIPTHNGAESLGGTLSACLLQTYPEELLEIVVVDDGSTDSTPGLLAMYEERSKGAIRHVRQENKGCAAARNRGIEHSTGEFIVFLDDDVTPTRYLVQHHVEFHNEHPNSVSQGLVLPHKDTHPLDRLIMGKRFPASAAHASEFEFAIVGSNFSAWRSDLEKVGMFDSELIRYQDTDLGFRLIKLLGETGFRIRVNRKAVVMHLERRDLRGWVCYQWSAGIYFIRWYRKHPDILDPRYSSCMRTLFESWIKGGKKFSSWPDKKLAKRVKECLDLGERAKVNSALEASLVERYWQLAGYAFSEGAYQELKGIRASAPSLCSAIPPF